MRPAVIFTILAIWTVLPGVVWAGDPPPFPVFTFKSVKVPAADATSLIIVQIDPNVQRARITVAKRAPPEAPVPQTGVFAWFWDQVPPELEAQDSGRLDAVVTVLRNSGERNGLVTPRLKSMQSLADRYGTDILVASVGTRVSPALVLAVMGVESGGRTDVVSTAGAVGLMQLIPATAARFGVADAKNAADNIRGGVAYLDWLMGEFDSDPVLVLAAYNAGENAVRRRGGVPEFAETRAYVPKVLAAWRVARGLCLSPPDLVSDGCVFSVQKAGN